MTEPTVEDKAREQRARVFCRLLVETLEASESNETASQFLHNGKEVAEKLHLLELVAVHKQAERQAKHLATSEKFRVAAKATSRTVRRTKKLASLWQELTSGDHSRNDVADMLRHRFDSDF